MTHLDQSDVYAEGMKSTGPMEPDQAEKEPGSGSAAGDSNGGEESEEQLRYVTGLRARDPIIPVLPVLPSF